MFSKQYYKSLLRECRLLSKEMEKKHKVLRKSTFSVTLSVSELNELIDLGQRMEQILFEVQTYLKGNKSMLAAQYERLEDE